MKKYTEDDLKSSDFGNLLAGSSGDEDENDNHNNGLEIEKKLKKKVNKEEDDAQTNGDEEDEKIRSYKELLLGVDKKAQKKQERDADMFFSWDGGMKEKGFDDKLFGRIFKNLN
jgi:hypothetical protein